MHQELLQSKSDRMLEDQSPNADIIDKGFNKAIDGNDAQKSEMALIEVI